MSILRLTQGVFEVISTGGDTALGGDDFDALIADHAASGLGSAELPPPTAARCWWRRVRRVKRCPTPTMRVCA